MGHPVSCHRAFAWAVLSAWSSFHSCTSSRLDEMLQMHVLTSPVVDLTVFKMVVYAAASF